MLNKDQIFLFEVSWEVCKQIGGIYRVIRSKVPIVKKNFDDNYCIIGPFFGKESYLEFEEQKPTGIFEDLLNELYRKNIPIKFGKWLISGTPNVILIDYLSNFYKIQEYKYYFYVDHSIETFDEQWLNDSIVFSYLVAEVIQIFLEILHQKGINKKVVSHFHEWITGATIPILRKRNVQTKIIFTTHATILGRYIATHVDNIYEYIKYINPYEEARKYNIFPHYLIERASAYGCDVFTAVSDITAEECKFLLHKEVDFITYNGLNVERLVVAHEHQNLHGINKEKIHKFISGHFFPYYTFDLDKTIYFFISGRYEFRNKGFDLYLDALASLNQKLIKNNFDLTVVAFIITKAATVGYSYEVLRNQFTYDELYHICGKISQNIPERLLEQLIEKPDVDSEKLITETEKLTLKRVFFSWKKEGLPSPVTHQMSFPDDQILNFIYKKGLFNQRESKVKIVYHPDFLSSFGSILKLDYFDFVRGCHLGIFPSYYEPWGYTPLECSVLGIPSISSDLSGFASFLEKNISNYNKNGFYIIKRKNKNYFDSVEELSNIMYNFLCMDRSSRIELRNKVERLSEFFDWKYLYNEYLKAYEKAIEMK